MLKDPEDSTGKLWSSRNMRKRGSRNVFWPFNKYVGGRCEALEPGAGHMVVNNTRTELGEH